MIRVEDVSLQIKDKTILSHVNAQFPSGQIHGLIGRNGSGKTMLMKCICGFIRPTQGRIWVNGQPVKRSSGFPPDMGLLIETPGFIPYYSGLRNLKLLASINRKISPAEIKASMATVGLDPDHDKPVRQYSLGMRQRLGIAQAIMERPRLLILDEPMNGLDKQGVAEMRALLRSLGQAGVTILLSSHNSEDIQMLCSNVWEMERGELRPVTSSNSQA